MTQEQNKPVRSRDEQVEDLTSLFGEEGTFTFVDDRDAATKHILEAEARGAAEQRRKDAEGEKPVAWNYYDEEDDDGRGGWRYSSSKPSSRYEDVHPLYTHPANVAALEARVKELEGENARLKTAQFYGHDEDEDGSDDISTFFDDHEPGTILEIDGYRRVNTKWVLWDGNSPHVFDTEEEASAALKREGSEE